MADFSTYLPHIQEAVLGSRTYYHDAAPRVSSAPNVCNDSDSDDSDESTDSEEISPIEDDDDVCERFQMRIPQLGML